MWDSIKPARRQFVALASALAIAAAAANAFANNVTSTWTGAVNTNWSNAGNWSPSSAFPSNGNNSVSDYDVVINSGGTPTLDTTATIDNLTLAATATLTLGPGHILNVNGPTVTNNGTIRIDTFSSNATLNFTSNTLLTGSGTVFLDDVNPNARITSAVGATLTSDANQTIHGVGEIDASFINNGTVNADISGQTIVLQTSNMTNNNLFEATTGGTLRISGITVTQGTSGVISNTGGAVSISNATISGGTISGGTVNIAVTSNFSNVSIASGATVVIASAQTLNYTGATLTNNGIIQIDTFSSNGTLNFLSNTTIAGSGSVFLDDESPNARITAAAGFTVTNSANQTIHGVGEIDAPFINNGTVNADFINQAIVLQTSNMTNNNLFEVTGSGSSLDIKGITVTQGSVGQISAAGHTVNLANATISGGTINGGTINVSGVSNFANLTIAAGTNVVIASAQTLNYTGATLTNNGIIQIDTFSSNATLNFLSNTTIAGSGSVFVDDNGLNARITAAAGFTVTNSANQTIHGVGEIDAPLINNGTVNADITNQTLFLKTSNMTNNNLFESTGTGATLSISGITVTQGASGLISAANGTVSISSNATISGGTISGSPVNVSNANFTNVAIASGTTIFMPGGTTLNYTGATLNNNGTIQVSDHGTPSFLNFTSNTSLNGTGSVLLNTWSPNAAITAAANVTLTNNQTIDGLGEIDAALINNGTVNSNTTFGSKTIVLQTNNMTNNNLFEATNGATLSITGITVTQSASGLISSANGTVSLSNATISGGTIGGGTVNVLANSTFVNLAIVSGTTVFMPGGTTLNYTGATLNNNGTIQVSDHGAPSFLNFTSNTSLNGTGSVLLNTWSPNAAITAAANATLTNNQTIDGLGEIDAKLINNSSIIANTNFGSKTININGVTTNNALIQATNTGVIQFGPGSILTAGTLNGGTYRIDTNSTMIVPAGTLFTNAATILFTGPNATFTGLASLTSNTGNLTLQNGATTTITGPLTNSGNVSLTGGANTTLTITGSYTQSANATLLNGNGTLIAGSFFGNLSNITGKAQVAPNGTNTGTSKLTGLTIAGATNAWTGDLDLTNNKVILEATAITKPTVLANSQNQVVFGKTHASGITGSTLPPNIGIAVIDNGALAVPFTSFGGQTVDNNSILITPEILGDANFDGTVTLTDLATVLNNFGQHTLAWTDGNFDGSPTIDLTDLADVLNNFGQSIINPHIATPEPASLSILAAVTLPTLLIRRRKSPRM